MQIGRQQFVLIGGRAVIHNGHNRDFDILFNGLKDRFADQPRAAKYWVDMDKERDVRVMVEQTENLQKVCGGFTTMEKR